MAAVRNCHSLPSETLRISCSRVSALPSQRVYLRCELGIEEYVNRWLGDDFAQVGEHARDEVLPGLWPWLRKRDSSVLAA